MANQRLNGTTSPPVGYAVWSRKKGRNTVGVERCDERIPDVPDAYFTKFTPPAFALMCEAALLKHKLGVMAGIEAGLIWAAVRSVEKGEVRCHALSPLTSAMVEASYSKLYRKLPDGMTWDRVELEHSMNLLVVLPPRTQPGARRLDFKKEVTPAILLGEVIAKFDFKHATNVALSEQGLDPRAVHDDLIRPGGFVAEHKLITKGTIRPEKQALYKASCAKAAYVGTWLLRRIHVIAAMLEADPLALSEQERSREAEQWQKAVTFAKDHVSGGGCVFLTSFPGPRPWLPSACSRLGVPEPEGYDLIKRGSNN